MHCRWNVRGAAVLLLAFALASCRPKATMPPSAAIAAVLVVPNSVTLAAGEGAQLVAEADDDGGRPVGGATLTFLSSNRSKLEVGSSGFVQSVGPSGQAQILVSSGGKQARVPVKIVAGPPRRLELVDGDMQTAVVGTTLPHPLLVRVLDGKSNPGAGSDITFDPADWGSAQPSASPTDSSGEARTRWTLGAGAGNQVLSVSIGATSIPATTFSANAESGPPATLTSVSEPDGTHSRESHALAVKVTDAAGNAKSGVVVEWSVERATDI